MSALVAAGTTGAAASVGPYELGRELGAGSFGRVFEALDGRTGARRAVKVFAPPGPGDGFVREAGVGLDLRHPNVMAVLDMGYLPTGARYVVYEVARGGSLRSRLLEGAPPLAFARHVLVELARALSALHERGLVHRDLKPENVLLSDDGTLPRVRLADLGSAGAVRRGGEGGMGDGGSPAYMAPEQVEGRSETRSDLYALGIIAYELLSGNRPFLGDPASVLAQHRSAPPDLSPLPGPAGRVVGKALSKAPEARHGSAYELARELDAALAAVALAQGARPSHGPRGALDEVLAHDPASGWQAVRREGAALVRGPGAPAGRLVARDDAAADVCASSPIALALRDGRGLWLGVGPHARYIHAPLYGLPPLVALRRFSGDVATVEGPTSPRLVLRRWDGAVRASIGLPFVLGSLAVVASRSGEIVAGVDAQRRALVLASSHPGEPRARVVSFGAPVASARAEGDRLIVELGDGRSLDIDPESGETRAERAPSDAVRRLP